MSVNEKMKAIADTIREKTGGTGLLTLDGMAAAIKAIETGGGLKFKFGSFTVAEPTKTITIQHGLGILPKMAIVYATQTSTVNGYTRLIFFISAELAISPNQSFGTAVMNVMNGNSGPLMFTSNNPYNEWKSNIGSVTENSFTIGSNGYANMFYTELNYEWLVLG